MDTPEHSFYAFTEQTVASLVHWAADAVLRLCMHPAAAFSSLFARGPGLYCTGRSIDKRYRLLAWKQTPGFPDEGALRRCIDVGSSQPLRALHTVSKQVMIHIALGHVPPELFPELRCLRRAQYENTRRRINPEKPYALPWACEDWHKQVREQYARRETSRWRTLCINPAMQKPEDVRFQLALLLLQEQMIPQDDASILRATMVAYLGCPPWNCEDDNTAYLVLEKLERNCIEPETWQTFSEYIQRYKSRERQKDRPCRVFHARREEERGEGTFGTRVKEAIAQCQREGLGPTRSTVSRWAQEWAIERPDWAMYDDDGELWLTSEGVAEVRTRLIRRALTQTQKLLGKDRKTAEKFTGRHTPDIQAAARRGETLRDITTALLGEDVLQELRQLQEDCDT